MKPAEEVMEMANTDGDSEERLPGLGGAWAWWKIIGVLVVMAVVNVVVFFATYMAGVIVTIPLTAFLVFLLLRDLMPRNRFPPGRPPTAPG